MNSTKPNLDALRLDIQLAYGKKWELNDQGHQQPHFRAVEECGNYINETLSLGQDPKLILYVAWFHDLFAWSRNNHHEIAFEWIKSTDCPIISQLTRPERETVAYACLEHRASGKGEDHRFHTHLSELMCAADRGFPTNAKALLARAINYRIEKGVSFNRAILEATEHVKAKYGTDGYAYYPKLYREVFGEALTLQRKEVDDLTLPNTTPA